MQPFKCILILSFIWVFVSAKPDNSATKLPGEDINIKIQVGAQTFLHGDLTFDIYKTKSSIKIVYSFLDSLRFSTFRTDTEVLAIERQHQQLSVSQPGVPHPFPARYGELIKKHEAFSRDSVLLDAKNYPAYCDLLNRIVVTSSEILENKEHNKKRILLDGTGVTFYITTNSSTMTISVVSPNTDSNPLLYGLLNSSQKLYYDNKGKGTANKK